MALLTLTVRNPSALPAGVAASCRMTGHLLAIGRDPGLDWVLPDPSRTISGRHCDIRAENGGYWLHDHSKNGVFVNGSAQRLTAPHRLANGDRLAIGRYLIEVTVSDVGRPAAAGGAAAADSMESRGGVDCREVPKAVPQPALRLPASADRFFETLCEAAGLSPDVLAGRDRLELAEEFGRFVRVTVEQLGLLLKSRAAARAMTRSAARTVLGAADNNPLKFVPDPAEAAEAMFGRRRSGYLDAARSLEEAFADLRRHELASYAAMQTALAQLLEPLSPEAIEAKAKGSLFGGAKSRAWEIYVERWEARNRGENGLLDAFFLHFAEAYDEEIGAIDLSP